MTMRKNTGYHILRVSMGITFAWIAVLIFKEPEFWSGFLPLWFTDLLPVTGAQFMYSVGALDAVLGALMLLDLFMWQVGALAALHMLGILLTTGIDSVTVRDIGLFGGCVSLMWADLPEKHRQKIVSHEHEHGEEKQKH
jgi:uncharacterized membrane protein YkgB